MLKVILTKGLPGSGKSTWAKKKMAEHPNMFKRVNKDELRAMIDADHWSRDTEKFILAIRDLIITEALKEGKHVIVDDTNLAPKHEAHIKQLVGKEVEVIIKDFTDVPIETCIKNDLNRLNSVGEAVIRKMYDQHLKPKPEVYPYDFYRENIVICDLDGTLCHLNGRNPYDASTCEFDGLNTVVAELLLGKKVILCSGREDKYREQTVKFLEKWNIPYEKLIMRPTGDFRKDSIIKKEMFDNHIRGKYNVEFVLDDRNQVVEMWRSLGLTCLQVAEGNF